MEEATGQDEIVRQLDPESEFLLSKRMTGNEWELYKENVRPLKRGRNVALLNHALKSHTHHELKNQLLQTRKALIRAIDDYTGDDPLLPWLQCIKWVQDAFPQGEDSTGLLVIYEQCVRTFWHSELYKDDLRYLKVWLEYAGHCRDAEIVYNFLDANGIGKTHSLFYISYALHLESKNKLKVADEIFERGISSKAQPIQKLKDAYRKFLARSMTRRNVTEVSPSDKRSPTRSFGTLLAGVGNRMTPSLSSGTSNHSRQDRINSRLKIFKDSNSDVALPQPSEQCKTDKLPWHAIGDRAERNKENSSIPIKWTSYKVPQRPASRIGGSTSIAPIEVFVDEECQSQRTKKRNGGSKSSTSQLGQDDGKELKKETELLRENPLRNFPPTSLPR